MQQKIIFIELRRLKDGSAHVVIHHAAKRKQKSYNWQLGPC